MNSIANTHFWNEKQLCGGSWAFAGIHENSRNILMEFAWNYHGVLCKYTFVPWKTTISGSWAFARPEISHKILMEFSWNYHGFHCKYIFFNATQLCWGPGPLQESVTILIKSIWNSQGMITDSIANIHFSNEGTEAEKEKKTRRRRRSRILGRDYQIWAFIQGQLARAHGCPCY